MEFTKERAMMMTDENLLDAIVNCQYPSHDHRILLEEGERRLRRDGFVQDESGNWYNDKSPEK
jgi:hypothetical protein